METLFADWSHERLQYEWDRDDKSDGTNYRTDTFAQPGLAAGAMYSVLTCASVRPAAVADALINSPNANSRSLGKGTSSPS